jgi:solute carrier family 12 (potassium/chloride transporter), member 4/6
MMKTATVKQTAGLGTFAGVYLPSLLTIFGVIMYLRMGLVVGSVGIVGAITIVLIATSITFLTGLSIAASATNTAVGGGGAYFLISRAFGKEIGAAIGLPLYLAQAIGISFYITGFVESLFSVAPGLPAPLVGVATLAVLTTLAFTSASLAIKTQGIILVAIIASLVSFFLGDDLVAQVDPIPVPRLSFWAAFALFFPAVTGIEAGVSMSGDLRNPSKSLVRGVLLAILTGLVVYLAICWKLGGLAPRDLLRADGFIVQHAARWGWMVVMGVWGATLSSGLGALLGGPRTLQALAQDGVVPRFLGKGYGAGREPRIATMATFLVSGTCIYLGRIDVIAPILTMFFLMSYGMLNLAAGLEGTIQNPSWRPTFRVPPLVCLTGSALCLMAMLMINPGASFVAFGFVGVLYFVTMRSSLVRGWDDIRQGALFFFSRLAIYRLSRSQTSARSWRPNFLVFTNGYSASENLLKFTTRITRGKGFLTVAPIFDKPVDRAQAKAKIEGLFRRKGIEALVTVTQETDAETAMERLVDSYGLGPLRPNTIVLGDHTATEARTKLVGHVITHATRQQRNVVVIFGEDETQFLDKDLQGKEPARIDVWWDDESKENSELMLVLAHMHQSSKGYGAIQVNVKCTVPNEAAREHRQAFFDDFFTRSRFRVSTQVYVSDNEQEEARLLQHFSPDANLIFYGLRLPRPDESDEDYLAYYKALARQHRRLPHLAYVVAAESVDLTNLFG